MKTDIAQLQYVHLTLRTLLVWLEDTTGVEFTETSRYRIDDDGVHGQLPVRGIDLRIRHVELGQFIAKLINSEWVYDPSREYLVCCVPHGRGSNYHLHIQVCDVTARRPD